AAHPPAVARVRRPPRPGRRPRVDRRLGGGPAPGRGPTTAGAGRDSRDPRATARGRLTEGRGPGPARRVESRHPLSGPVMPEPDLGPSVFDRLADPALATRAATQGYSVRELEDAVRDDLLDLLNTHRPPEGSFAGNPDVARSVANYGIRDLAH